MGICWDIPTIPSTTSYLSADDAFAKMLSQLDYLRIPVFISLIDNGFYVVEDPRIRRNLRINLRENLWGREYYECYID